jgi:hypothetical protein
MNRKLMAKPFTVAALWFGLIAATHSQAQDQKLLGCWVTELVTNFYVDSLPSQGKSNCILYYEDDLVTSACDSPQGVALISYIYKTVRPGVYEAKMVTNDRLPDLIGSVREYEYRVVDDKLLITTYPQTTKPLRPSKIVRFESISNYKVSVSKKDCQNFSNSEILNAAAEVGSNTKQKKIKIMLIAGVFIN